MTTKRMTIISLFTTMIIVLNLLLPKVYLPVINVPVTLQSFVVMLSGLMLLPIDAFLSMFLYIIMGLIGLPVFSGYNSGIGAILSPTGGFIISFPIIAFFISYFTQKNISLLRKLLFISIFGIGVLYLIGTIWLDYYLEGNFIQIITGMALLIPFDFLKAVIALNVSIKLNKFV